jgi:hypothetical protein
LVNTHFARNDAHLAVVLILDYTAYAVPEESTALLAGHGIRSSEIRIAPAFVNR